MSSAAKSCADAVHGAGLVLDFGVDLAGGDVGLVFAAQLGERAVLLTECGQDVHGGQHAGVSVPEIPEVEVGRVLAAEHGAFLGHDGLDEGVAHARADGAAAVVRHQFRHRAGGEEVVDDRGGVFALGLRAGDLAAGHHAGDGRRRDGLALFVDHEAAVGVAVERQADVRAVLDDGGLQVAEVFRLQRVGRVVGEGAVQFEVERNDVEGQLGQERVAEDGGGGQAGHAVAGVHHDLQRAGTGEVHQLAQVLGVVLRGRRGRRSGRGLPLRGWCRCSGTARRGPGFP